MGYAVDRPAAMIRCELRTVDHGGLFINLFELRSRLLESTRFRIAPLAADNGRMTAYRTLWDQEDQIRGKRSKNATAASARLGQFGTDSFGDRVLNIETRL